MPAAFPERLFRLRSMGVLPILTHPERHGSFQGREDRLQEFIRLGAFVQITAGRLTGRFGAAARRSAVRTLRAGLVHSVATDAHSLRARPPCLAEGVDAAARLVGERVAMRLVTDVPDAVLRGEPIDTGALRARSRCAAGGPSGGAADPAAARFRGSARTGPAGSCGEAKPPAGCPRAWPAASSRGSTTRAR